MACLITQKLILYCLVGLSLLSLGIIQGCVGQVDLQVLRADMETLKYEYQQHNQAIDSQLDAFESRTSAPIQELDQTASTLADLRGEIGRLRLNLQSLQREGDGTQFAADMQTSLAYLETRLDIVARHPVIVKKPSIKLDKTTSRASQTPPTTNIPIKRPVTKRAKQKTRDQPPIEKTAKDVSPKPSKTAQQKPEVASSSIHMAKPTTPKTPPSPQPTSPKPLTLPKPTQSSPVAKQNSSMQQKSAPPKLVSTDQNDVRLYEKALRTYQEENYEGALGLLKHFLDQYASSPLAGSVQYWIGESLYAQNRYKAAIMAFNDVVQNYPEDTKVPAAMLNQGLAFAKLRNVNRARALLEQVQEKYANSSEAEEATATLKQLSR